MTEGVLGLEYHTGTWLEYHTGSQVGNPGGLNVPARLKLPNCCLDESLIWQPFLSLKVPVEIFNLNNSLGFLYFSLCLHMPMNL